MGFDYFWHQQHFKSLFKGTIGHVTSCCKWPIVYNKRVINNNNKSIHLPNSLGNFLASNLIRRAKETIRLKNYYLEKKKEVKETYVRSRQDSNLRGETPMDF